MIRIFSLFQESVLFSASIPTGMFSLMELLLEVPVAMRWRREQFVVAMF
jgi:hypothetical protein